MTRVISRESVRRGNAAMISGSKRGISVDGRNISVRCNTVVGERTMTFSREQIVREARKAFVRVVK